MVIKLMFPWIVTPKKIPRDYFFFIVDKTEFTPKAGETYKERVTQVYRTKISLNNPNRELKKGMPAEAVIYLEDQKP